MTDLIDHRLDRLEAGQGRIEELLRELTAIEARQAEHSRAVDRAFGALEEHGRRLNAIETALPTLKQTSAWIITAVSSALLALGSIITMAVTRVLGRE